MSFQLKEHEVFVVFIEKTRESCDTYSLDFAVRIADQFQGTVYIYDTRFPGESESLLLFYSYGEKEVLSKL